MDKLIQMIKSYDSLSDVTRFHQNWCFDGNGHGAGDSLVDHHLNGNSYGDGDGIGDGNGKGYGFGYGKFEDNYRWNT